MAEETYEMEGGEGVWYEYLTPQGDTFYHCPASMQSTWEPPLGEGVVILPAPPPAESAQWAIPSHVTHSHLNKETIMHSVHGLRNDVVSHTPEEFNDQLQSVGFRNMNILYQRAYELFPNECDALVECLTTLPAQDLQFVISKRSTTVHAATTILDYAIEEARQVVLEQRRIQHHKFPEEVTVMWQDDVGIGECVEEGCAVDRFTTLCHALGWFGDSFSHSFVSDLASSARTAVLEETVPLMADENRIPYYPPGSTALAPGQGYHGFISRRKGID